MTSSVGMDSTDDVTSSMARRSLVRGISISIVLHAFILSGVVLWRPGPLSQALPPFTLIELVNEEPIEPEELKPQAQDAPSRAPEGRGEHPQIHQSPAALVARALEKHGTQAIDSMGIGKGRGEGGSSTLKDFVRSQVEKQWNVELARGLDRNWSVQLHLTMEADGTIEAVQVLTPIDMDGDAPASVAARSARNAAYLASPLHLPDWLKGARREFDIELRLADAGR